MLTKYLHIITLLFISCVYSRIIDESIENTRKSAETNSPRTSVGIDNHGFHIGRSIPIYEKDGVGISIGGHVNGDFKLKQKNGGLGMSAIFKF